MVSRTNPIEVSCTECRFSKEVPPSDDKLPAEYVIEHGKETGHILRTSRSAPKPA